MDEPREVEIKFRVADVAALEARLQANKFSQKTPPTFEINTLYDRNGKEMQGRGELLRLRRYGEKWKLTFKSKGEAGGKHKSRVEHETALADGDAMRNILTSLGYAPTFRYEKYRSEWTDGPGEVVVDRTPLGDIAEIEGPPDWIDATAMALGISERDYITESYAALFFEWKRTTGSPANNMTFEECGTTPPKI